MNKVLSILVAILASIVIFILVWLPIGMLMAYAGGYIAILGLAWGFFCFYVARKGYKWILDKLLKRSDKEEVLNVEDISLSEGNDDQLLDSKEIK